MLHDHVASSHVETVFTEEYSEEVDWAGFAALASLSFMHDVDQEVLPKLTVQI